MPVTAADLARYRTLRTRYMLQTVTNARTGHSGPCMVLARTREEHLEGLPPEARTPQWTIDQPPEVTDIGQGDRLTVTGFGLYTVLLTDSPRSYQTATRAVCLKIDHGDGYTLPMIPNTSVRLENLKSGELLDAIPTFVEQSSSDAIAGRSSVKYPYALHLPPEAHYPSGLAISAGDLLVWSGLPNGSATINKPRRVYGPIEWLVLPIYEVT